ncbi:cation:proton antiporter [Halosolutus amylolyticus]|uniref:Cation:proton antiporter n=1 Tax=Halosolutus amylolyticus TaxID=2932267 RepID=A0ABD5PLE2_9EURY|nr:cation:proton antiporter [Halosolutus amylolyticus]
MSELVTALSVIFVVGGAFLLVANRFDLPTIPFLILAGLVTGTVIEERLTLELARYGIALLVFAFGARIQFDAIRFVLDDSELVAIGQVVVTGSIGVATGVLVGLSAEQATYLGVAAALSSTTVGTSLLEPDVRENLVHGRLAESIQFVHDVLAIVFVLTMSVGAATAPSIATKLGFGVAIVGTGVLINRVLFEYVGVLADESDEVMIVSVVALLVAFLTAAELVGVSIVVGAFAAGLAVRHEPAEHIGVLNGLASITDFFAAVFFVTLGALVSVPTADAVIVAATLVVLTVVVKPAVTIGLLIHTGYEARSATLTGLTLDQISEFALVIAIEALLLGILGQSVFDAIVLTAALTMITSSLSHRHAERVYRTLTDRGLLASHHEKVDERSAVPDDVSDHVVIVGYGRQGQRLVETCEDVDRPYVVIENDPALLTALDAQCAGYVFGNAMEPYTREKASLEDARLIVSTVDSTSLSDRLLSLADGTDVILRARSTERAFDLLDRGALYVNVPDRLAADRLVEHIEELIEGDRSRESLRRWHVAELDERSVHGYHTAADELRATR